MMDNATKKPLTTQEQVDAFLIDLAALSLKHGIIIGGCGCDGSPWIARLDGYEEPLDGNRYVGTGFVKGVKDQNLEWDNGSQTYIFRPS